MYASIRQGKAKAGMAEELTRRIKDDAIPIISRVPEFSTAATEWSADLRAEEANLAFGFEAVGKNHDARHLCAVACERMSVRVF